MRIAGYELALRPSPGWQPPGPRARVLPSLTFGGAVVHTAPGSMTDVPLELVWGAMPINPQETLLRTAIGAASVVALDPGERIAIRLTEAGPIAPTAVTVSLGSTLGATGWLDVEVWDVDGGIVGRLGTIDAADLGAAAGQYYISSPAGFPLFAGDGYLVLSAARLEAASEAVQVYGTVGAGTYYAWTGAPPAWAGQVGTLAWSVWQGTDYCILQGLAAAYNYPGEAGPDTITVDLEDGQIYSAAIISLQSAFAVAARQDGPGVARDVRLLLAVLPLEVTA